MASPDIALEDGHDGGVPLVRRVSEAPVVSRSTSEAASGPGRTMTPASRPQDVQTERVVEARTAAPDEAAARPSPDAPLLPLREPPREPAPYGGNAPSARGASGESEAPAEPAPEPPVRVTIGRIEVRAVLPEPVARPAPKPSWQPPVLSLDDYLRGASKP